jgi:putative membrane protein
MTELRSALALFSRGLDSVWTALGAVLVYLAVVRAEGIDVARRWCGLAIIVGFIVSAASAATGWPLGPVSFPQNLGWKIGPVPFALPLLWLLLIIGSREVALRLLPKAGHASVSLLTGALTLGSILNLDPIAWKYRAWWLWYPLPGTGLNHAPWQCFITWACAGVGLAWLMRSPHVAPRVPVRPMAPVTVWCVLNGICAVTDLALRLR